MVCDLELHQGSALALDENPQRRSRDLISEWAWRDKEVYRPS